MTKPKVILDIPVNHGRQIIISADPTHQVATMLRTFITTDERHIMISAWNRETSVRSYFLTGKDKIYHLHRLYIELMEGIKPEIRILGKALYRTEDGYDCVDGAVIFKKGNRENQYEVKFLNEGTEAQQTYYMQTNHAKYIRTRFKELSKYINSPTTYTIPMLG